MMQFSTETSPDFGDINPQNSVLKLYEDLVKDGKIRSDPGQIAVINRLDRWQADFIAKEPRIQAFQKEYEKVADFGRSAPRLARK